MADWNANLQVAREAGRVRPVSVGPGLTVGDGTPVVIAGPCAVESAAQTLAAAEAVKRAGARLLRGGAFKPRTSPYSFQGLGVRGLEILAEVRARTGLPVVTEVLDVRDVEQVCRYADVLQIGARNMQNVPLLQEVGAVHRPVLLKRGPGATVREWILAAEYVASRGNERIILCERGIRTFETETRYTLDLAAVALVHCHTHLPVVVDPSHAAGRRELVPPLARAALAAGADGLLVEVHPSPAQALSDGRQSLSPDQFTRLMAELGLAPQPGSAHPENLRGNQSGPEERSG